MTAITEGRHGRRRSYGAEVGALFFDVMNSLNPTQWWRMHDSGSPLANLQTPADDLPASPTGGITYNSENPLGAGQSGDSIDYTSATGRHYEQVGTFLGGTTGSIFCIIKVPSTGPADNGVIVGISNAGGAIQGGIRTRVNGSTHHLQTVFQNSGNFFTRRVDTPVIDDDAWHTVCVTQANDSSGPQIYLDSALIGSGDRTDGTGGTGYGVNSWFAQVITAGASATAIAAQAGTSSTNRFVGKISEVAYWNGTVLTSTNVSDLHTAAALV